MWGERTFQFQPHFVAPLHTPHRQPLAGMPILDNQLANTALGHHISCLERHLKAPRRLHSGMFSDESRQQLCIRSALPLKSREHPSAIFARSVLT